MQKRKFVIDKVEDKLFSILNSLGLAVPQHSTYSRVMQWLIKKWN
jgi:hypothetical protein